MISPGVFFISDLAERQLFMAGSVLLLDILVVTIYDKKNLCHLCVEDQF